MTDQNCLRLAKRLRFQAIILGFIANNVARTQRVRIGTVKGAKVGDRIELVNPVNGESASASLAPEGSFVWGW